MWIWVPSRHTKTVSSTIMEDLLNKEYENLQNPPQKLTKSMKWQILIGEAHHF